MATQVQRRRGSTVGHSTFTGVVGETTVDTDKKTVIVHDGATQGGFPLLREDFSNNLTPSVDRITLAEYAEFDTGYTPTESEPQGALYWNPDERTLSLVTNGQTTELGQKLEVECRNNTGSTIARGVPVYASGTIGNSGRITVAPMIADGTIDAKYIVGVTDEQILNGEDGKVVKVGKIRKINTSAYSEGDVLYVSETSAGAWTSTKPSVPNISLPIAFVVTDSAQVGEIFIRVEAIDENAFQPYDAQLTNFDFASLNTDTLNVDAFRMTVMALSESDLNALDTHLNNVYTQFSESPYNGASLVSACTVSTTGFLGAYTDVTELIDNANNPAYVRLGDAQTRTSGTGVYMSANNEFRAGDPTGNYIDFDGVTLDLVTDTFDFASGDLAIKNTGVTVPTATVIDSTPLIDVIDINSTGVAYTSGDATSTGADQLVTVKFGVENAVVSGGGIPSFSGEVRLRRDGVTVDSRTINLFTNNQTDILLVGKTDESGEDWDVQVNVSSIGAGTEFDVTFQRVLYIENVPIGLDGTGIKTRLAGDVKELFALALEL